MDHHNNPKELRITAPMTFSLKIQKLDFENPDNNINDSHILVINDGAGRNVNDRYM